MSNRNIYGDTGIGSIAATMEFQSGRSRATVNALDKAEARGDRWEERARKLEVRVRELAADLEAGIELGNEILEEIEGGKPVRLSDPKNRHLRQEYVNKHYQAHIAANKHKDALDL